MESKITWEVDGLTVRLIYDGKVIDSKKAKNEDPK